MEKVEIINEILDSNVDFSSNDRKHVEVFTFSIWISPEVIQNSY